MTINEKISIRGIAKNWMDETQSNLKKNVPTHTSSLKRSIETRQSGGESTMVLEFSYFLYGKFVDMGVGKGRTGESKSELKLINRLEGKKGQKRGKGATWYQREMYGRMKRLEGSIANYYGDEFIKNFNKLPQLIEM